MTIRDLIEELEQIVDEHGDDIEVRLAQQPRWAFEYSISTVAVVDAHARAEVDGDAPDDDETEAPVVYIGEGRQLGYLPDVASRVLGWGRER